MLNIHTKQHIRFVTVEKPEAFHVYAILLETTGNETIAISEPKLVRVVAKKGQLALKGSTSLTLYSLPSPELYISLKSSRISSPYFSILFGSEKSNFITGLAAQPPTICI